MSRLFIAFPLSKRTTNSLANIILKLQGNIQSVRWVKPENIHLTLKFLGETDSLLIPDIKCIIDKVAINQNILEMHLNRLGAFPHKEKPRVIWIGSSKPTGVVSGISDELDEALSKLGIAKEKKPFEAHLTLGRVKQGKSIRNIDSIFKQVDFPAIGIILDRLTLYQSTLTPDGPLYKKLYESLHSSEKFEG